MKTIFVSKIHAVSLIIVLVLSTQTFSQIHISGELSGTLTDTTYIVDDDAYVNSSLTIEPGAVLRFTDGAQFDINGLLLAEGTVEDTIYFILNDGAQAWGGIDFNPTSSWQCRLSYCYISGSNSSGIMCQQGSEPYSINHCVITNNSASDPDQEYLIGGGIFWRVDFFVEGIKNCTVSNNEDCGIFLAVGSDVELDSLIITNNSDGGIIVNIHNLILPNSIISYNVSDTSDDYRAGGITCGSEGSGISAQNCIISHNSGYYGALYSDLHATFVNCTISNNYSESYIGGIFAMRCVLQSCIINNNTGLYCGGMLAMSIAIIDHCTFVGNSSLTNNANIRLDSYNSIMTNSIIAFNQGNGIYLLGGDGGFDIRNNLIFSNTPENIIPSNRIDTLGIIVTTNLNGDSCDYFYNLFLDPMFADTGAGDYSLTEESPCIDAGTPDSTYDPDNTITDIGAIYFNQAEVPHSQQSESPETFRVSPAYPNPFNAVTRLRIDVPYTSSVHVSVFDILGRQVLVLKEDVLSCGVHELVIDGSSLSSGTYFISVLFNESHKENCKIVLLK